MQMDVFFIFATVAFFIWSIRSIFYFVNEWQSLLSSGVTKRVSFAYLFSLLFSPLSFLTWLAVVFSIFVTFSDFPLEYDQYVILALFLLKAGIAVSEISRSKFKIPTFTTQTVIIICLSLLVTAFAFAFPLSERYLWLLLLDRLLFIFVAIPIFLVLFPSEIVEDLQVRAAVKQLKSYKKIQPVLILGNNAKEISYFLEQIVSKDHEVVLLADAFMRMGTISKTVRSSLTSQTEYLIIAYPNSNLSSLEAILRQITFSTIILGEEKNPLAKTRLISLLNSYLTPSLQLLMDSTYQRENFKKKKKNIITFSSDSAHTAATIFTKTVQQRKARLAVTLDYQDEVITFITPLIGTQHVLYLIPSLLFSLQIGIKKQSLVTSLNSLTPLPGQFVEHRLQSGLTLIDATLCVAPSVIKQGLSYLKLFRKNKVIIFGIEDELTKSQIKDLSSELAFGTTILVLGQKHQLLLRKLLRVGTDKIEVRTSDEAAVLKFIRARLAKDDVVLFLGEKTASIVESILLYSSTLK